jgi:phosphatidylserine/phosphatidylglycerophosphate/cardiolipin synthase-like enzyme
LDRGLNVASLLLPSTDPSTVASAQGMDEPARRYLPARGRFVPLIDGAETFGAIGRAMQAAQKTIHVMGWLVHTGVHLRARSKSLSLDQLAGLAADPSERRLDVVTPIDRLLVRAMKRGVAIRILMNEPAKTEVVAFGKKLALGFHGLSDVGPKREHFEKLATKPGSIAALASEHGHRFGIGTDIRTRFFSADEIRAASYHEKLVIVDGKAAFCGGIDLVRSYEGTTTAHRERGPKHDVHALVTGAAARSIDGHFVELWNHFAARARENARDEAERERYADAPVPETTEDSEMDRAHALQIVSTRPRRDVRARLPASADAWLPELPSMVTTHQVADAYYAAVESAERYVYVENQYVRDEGLVDKLVAALARAPELVVIVVVPAQSEEIAGRDPNEGVEGFLSREMWRAVEVRQREELVRLRDAAPERTGVFTLERAGKGMYVHSKVMIIDDVWATVGTCNANSRGFFLDGELNVIVRDDGAASALRRRLWSEHLGGSVEGKPSELLAAWRREAEKKKLVRAHTLAELEPVPWVAPIAPLIEYLF